MHSYVHRLRSSFAGAGERIETVGAGYRLRLEPGELDVERFEDPAATARRFADNGDTAEALDAITAAEGLWRGRPFGEFADEAWALGDVTRLVELHVGRRELRAEILLGAGQPSAIRSRLSLEPNPDDRGELSLRKGLRLAWIEEALAPVRDQLPDDAFERLVHALALTIGIEPIVVLTDLAGLGRDEALDVIRWSTHCLVRSSLDATSTTQ